MTQVSSVLTHNQKILAQAKASLANTKKPDEEPPARRAMTCLKEAIEDARHRLKTMQAEGKQDSDGYLDLLLKSERWEFAWRMNR